MGNTIPRRVLVEVLNRNYVAKSDPFWWAVTMWFELNRYGNPEECSSEIRDFVRGLEPTPEEVVYARDVMARAANWWVG